MRIVSFLFLLIAGIYSHSGWAETCKGDIGQMTVNVQNIKYLPTLPLNTQMTGVMADNGSGIHFSCDLQVPKAAAKRLVYRQLKTASSPLSIGGQYVFPSALEGIGYSLGFQCSGGAVRFIDGSHAADNAESVTVCDSQEMANLLNQQQIVVKVFVTFYKTGDVALVSGNHANVPAQPQIGELTIQQQADSRAGFVASSPVTLDMAALNVDIGSSGSCQVSTTNIHVSLGTVNKAEFKGKSTTGGSAKSFSIPVFCSTPTDIRIGFFGVTSPGGGTDTLALSKANASASGVGVRLTYGNNSAPAPAAGTSVKINEASNLPVLKRVNASSAGSAENINFNAQYVQTDDAVTAGTANSMVTFALEYN
ncbi:fimbrial protein [Klebsiella oxytoca]|uniref:fimbrial protein n=1 Tax=Klebsiella oxytoca TaxID=571 RepID=UPI0003BF52C9|nr:fimbrial protein [Klebsiella oxytoca]ESM99547.1 fimbrial-like protein [Klebsiella oxytoca MGH 28]MCE0406950.1 fimbrial protein [Klebsiella oxytoca]HEC2089225.1 fimbrial protein [Klebsiella oxytoca]